MSVVDLVETLKKLYGPANAEWLAGYDRGNRQQHGRPAWDDEEKGRVIEAERLVE